MAKKESAIRGHMNFKDVSEHLKNLSGSYEGGKAKIAYLQKVLDKETLLAPATRTSVREVLVKEYQEDHNHVEADKVLIEMGGDYRAQGINDLKEREDNPKAAEVLADNKEFGAAARIYANIGYKELNQRSSSNIDFDKVKKTLTRAADLYEKSGDLGSAADAVIRSFVGTHSGEISDGIIYGALIEKAAEKEEYLSQKVHYFREARERYQVAGKTAKALAIGKKLGPLEAKLQAEDKGRSFVAIGVAGASLVSAGFFSSTKLTGNVVGLSNQTSSLIGLGLIIVAILTGYIWLKSKNKKVIVIKQTKKKKKF